MSISDPLNAEARAFDERIEERLRHGHWPDLRRVKPCDWFYNNPWRRPYLVAMDCGRAFEFALRHAKPARLLEICCGVGHMSLEFGRHGFQVTGLDISGSSLEVAKRVLAENPFIEGFGNVRYIQEDFLSWEAPPESFETVCCFGGLHHVEALDQVADKIQRLLVPGGRVIIQEPARDWISEKNAAAAVLIRLLLSAGERWYAPMPLPANEDELRTRITECLTELKEGRDIEEAKQSPHDNVSGAEEILAALTSRFHELERQRINGYLQRIIGGVRGSTEEQTQRLAEFLALFDRAAVRMGLFQPGEVYWAGEKASKT